MEMEMVSVCLCCSRLEQLLASTIVLGPCWLAEALEPIVVSSKRFESRPVDIHYQVRVYHLSSLHLDRPDPWTSKASCQRFLEPCIRGKWYAIRHRFGSCLSITVTIKGLVAAGVG